MSQDNILKELVKQVEDLDLDLLYSGLTIIAKDTAEYLATSAYPGKGDSVFFTFYKDAMNIERDDLETHGPKVFQSLENAGLPRGFAFNADNGRYDLLPLKDPMIIHEWLVNPGVRILEKFKDKFKDTICGKDGPYEKFKDGLIGQADLPTTIAAAVLLTGFSIATFWYPLAIYLGILLVKTGLKMYCEE